MYFAPLNLKTWLRAWLRNRVNIAGISQRTQEYINDGLPRIGVARGNQESHAPPNFSSTSCRFVLWEAVSQIKYCYSLTVKIFDLPKSLCWLRFWLHTAGCGYCFVHADDELAEQRLKHRTSN